jgi:hypothetical protein
VLVAAMLRPEDREDGELEVVRSAPEELPDVLKLPVGETERAMEGLLGDCAQAASVTAAPGCSLSSRMLPV